jgi:hypothetical protein
VAVAAAVWEQVAEELAVSEPALVHLVWVGDKVAAWVRDMAASVV